ncbi:PAS domain-containing methyl-accepting chemotaxis protein [Psychromonas sp. psych-6C06]|uniref:methyl-accepting chemotaxis protein n=1 Tax=Psychromonas sp. psych-6C06 TaxID=2058089 RepID=UPI001931010A
MRNNTPVTNNEYVLTDKDLIVSNTDMQGNITYINDDFLRISGFTEAELMGQPQNIVRHPDMPAEAFEDLWRDLKAGIPWTGFVKNRCKNGDFYWVKANATPIIENGQITGYMSVREAPSRTDIEAISAIYRLFKQGKQGDMQIYHGQVITPKWTDKLAFFTNMNFKKRINTLLAFLVLTLFVGLGIGFLANYETDQVLNDIYADHIKNLENERQVATTIHELQSSLHENGFLSNTDIEKFKTMSLPPLKELDETLTHAKTLYIKHENSFVYKSTFMIVSTLLAIVIFIFLMRKFSQLLLQPSERAQGYLRELCQGNYSFDVETNSDDEINSVLLYLKMMQIKLGFEVEDMKRAANEATRIKIGLDSVSTNVMIADNNRNIIYMNNSIVPMLRNAQDDLRKELPSFDVDKLPGSNIDQFHKKPEHQKKLLATFTSEFKTEIMVGGRTFLLVANPVINEAGDRLGSVIEWTDRTAEVAVEKEVEGVVNGAIEGDFTKRMDLEGKNKFFTQLSAAINSLMETSETGLTEVVRMLSALSKGDLTDRITNEYQGTFGQLKDDSNLTADKLKEIVLQIQEATDTINTASKEIAMGNSDLSQRTEEQASSLEETASSMEELTTTVKQNAENAKQANQLANGASDIAVKGGDVVGKVVKTMSDINESSREIVDIISVIDGIAFQTNILALNAAVEAARAGEQGRGFAVVASEVRSLAQRSAAAAKEIKTLIGDSVDKVEVGAKLVDEAGKTMDEIVNAVKSVTDIMAEIATASEEQSSGIDQVSQAITQMDEVTQQNAALVEEAAAAAESLEEQAGNLSVSVSVFNTGAGHSSTAMSANMKAIESTKAGASYNNSSKVSDDDEWSEF